MARIMDIRKCNKVISVKNKTVIDFNSNNKYFSIWVHTAGQESGIETCPLNMQFDLEMAKRLKNYLNQFIECNKKFD
jgi:hypothetical protein